MVVFRWHRLRGLFGALVVASISVPVVTPISVYAEDVSHRINISGRQRMLSQRMVKALCSSVLLGGERFASEAQDAIRLYDASLRALTTGGAEGIRAPEGNASVQDAIEQVATLWYHLSPDYWELSLNRADPLTLPELLDDNIMLLRLSDDLVTAIETAYRDPAQVFDGLRSVNRSGLMRMLAEKSVKEMCLIQLNLHTVEVIEDLQGTIARIETNLSDLRNGNNAALISPPPTHAISKHLAQLHQLWQNMRIVLQVSVEGQVITETDYITLYNAAGDFVAIADRVTYLYAQHYAK